MMLAECGADVGIGFVRREADAAEVAKRIADRGVRSFAQSADLTDPRLTRVDPTVNFEWGEGSPGTVIDSNSFSVRWSGKVQAPDIRDCGSASDDRHVAEVAVNERQRWLPQPLAQNGAGSVRGPAAWGLHTVSLVVE